MSPRLRFHSHSRLAMITPENTVWVNPMPGQPRCHWWGIVEP